MHDSRRRRLPALCALFAGALLTATACGPQGSDELARPPEEATSSAPTAQSTARGDVDAGAGAAERAAEVAYAREVTALLNDLTSASNTVADVFADADPDDDS